MTTRPRNAKHPSPAHQARRTPRSGSRDAEAFTLVEMLAVILIIGILVTIVVGIGSNLTAKRAVLHTRQNMEAIMNAVRAYHEQNTEYPVVYGSSVKDENAKLYAMLMGCPAAKKRLAQLGRSAYVELGGNRYFVDGFGNPLKYQIKGTTPYLESGGPDEDFSTTEDNIRSDNR